MLILLATLLASSPLDFKGGSIEALVQTIRMQCDVSVVAEIYDGDQRIRAFKCDRDAETIGKTVSKLSGYTLIVLGRTYILRTGKLSPRLYNPRGNKTPAYARGPFEPDGIDAGYSMLHPMDSHALRFGSTVDGTVRTDEFASIGLIKSAHGWSKPVVGNRWFDEIPIAFSVYGLSQTEFLTAIAAVVGAKPVGSDAGFVFKFDPKRFKARFLASADDPAVPVDPTTASGLLRIARREVGKVFVRDVDESFLASAFEKPPHVGSGFEVQSSTALFDTVNSFAQRIGEYFRSDESRGNPVRALEIADLARVDPYLPKGFSFMPPAEFIVTLPFQGGGSLAQE